MWANRDNFTALSVLPHSEHTYIQAPFEDITQEQYEEMVKVLHSINLDDVIEFTDDTSLQGEVACGGGACEVV
jgi:ribonucleoside-diphosphate reductase alpha chain